MQAILSQQTKNADIFKNDKSNIPSYKKEKIISPSYSTAEKSNQQNILIIKNFRNIVDNQNSSLLNINTDSKQIFTHGNTVSKDYNTWDKRSSYLVLNKNNKSQSRSYANDINVLGLLNYNQLKRKSTVIGGKRNNFMFLDYINSESDKYKINKIFKKKIIFM